MEELARSGRGAPVEVGSLRLGGGGPLFLIAGPCALESEVVAFTTAERLKALCEEMGLPLVFKGSYAKANRSSPATYRGPGMAAGLALLARIREEWGLPVLADVHCREEVGPGAEVCDILQVPAFLCRQTPLLEAVGRAGRAVNLKKGQFVSPEEMAGAVGKVAGQGNARLLLTERGTTFGYHDLVVDMRSLVIMRRWGYPVVFDATHAVQSPGGRGDRSGGAREFALPLARAAIAAGCDGLFLETHPNPERALSDAETQIPLRDLPAFLREVKEIDEAVRGVRAAAP